MILDDFLKGPIELMSSNRFLCFFGGQNPQSPGEQPAASQSCRALCGQF